MSLCAATRPADAERNLALAVLRQAVKDDAHGFLRGGFMLTFWCDIAGVEPGAVVRMADKARRVPPFILGHGHGCPMGHKVSEQGRANMSAAGKRYQQIRREMLDKERVHANRSDNQPPCPQA